MGRKAPDVLIVLLAALPSRALETPDPILVNPAAVQKQADDLQSAALSPSIGDPSVHDQAATAFTNIQRETPIVQPACRDRPNSSCSMDRESVSGDKAVVSGDRRAGMIENADERYDHYRLTTHEVPPTELANAMEYAKTMHADDRAAFKSDRKMPDNEMGEFVYNPKDEADKGFIKLNTRLALIATRIGVAFCYPVLVHEAAHALARLKGRLSPEHVIDGELEAYRVQYEMTKVLDPTSERTIVLISTLQLHLRDDPKDEVTRASIGFLKFQLDLLDTNGEEGRLRDLIKKLGYEEGDGVSPEATPLRS